MISAPVPAVDAAVKLHPAWFDITINWPAQGDLISWCHNMGPGLATLLVIAGIVYLVFGVYLFKALVTLNAGLVGAYLGAMIGYKTGGGGVLPWALIGGFTMAALAWPLMKYAVAMTGGLYGFLLGAAMWRTAGLEANYTWAGGMMGLIAFGMLSFILFRGSIMMYMSLQGSVMLVFGLLGLIFKYQSLSPQIMDGLTGRPFLLPVSIFIPAVLGLIYQQAQFGAAPAGGGGDKK